MTYDSLFSDLVSYSSANGVATDGDDESQVMLTPRGRFLADVSDHIVKFLRLGLVDIEDAMALRECVMTSPYTDFSGRTASAGDLCLATSIAVRIVRRSGRYAYARRRSAEVGVVMTSPFNLDFVDMLWLPVVMTGSVALGEVEKFGWIFVDEAQDLSRVGVELVRMFRATHADSGRKGRIVAVGDPNQAIYGFAGADADAVRFLISPKNNSDRQTEVMSLSTCFRCPTEPLRYAQCLVPDIVPNTGAPEDSPNVTCNRSHC